MAKEYVLVNGKWVKKEKKPQKEKKSLAYLLSIAAETM